MPSHGGVRCRRPKVSLVAGRSPPFCMGGDEMAATYKMFIDGEWTDAKSGQTLGVINPANEEIIAEIPYGGREDAARAVAAAARAFPEWSAKTPYERATVLKRTAELMRERLEAMD